MYKLLYALFQVNSVSSGRVVGRSILSLHLSLGKNLCTPSQEVRQL